MRQFLISGVVFDVTRRGNPVEVHQFREVISCPLCNEDDIREYEDKLCDKHKYDQALIMNIVRLPNAE